MIVGSGVVASLLSGGGMRAAACLLGVLQALADADAAGTDIFDELTFLSKVSGGSLTATCTALHGRGVLSEFRPQVLTRDPERDLRLSLLSPVNLARLLAGGVHDRSNLAATLDTEVFKGATFADLCRSKQPGMGIKASKLYNRTPFAFIPPVFQGLCSDPHGPYTEADAVRRRRMPFLIVDAGRPPAGNWALQLDGPSGMDMGIAAADAAIDSTTRLIAAARRARVCEWRDGMVRFRCGLSDGQVRRHLPVGQAWQSDGLHVFVDTVSTESLEPARAARMRDAPTRLTLTQADIDEVITAGRDAARRSPALRNDLADRMSRSSPAPAMAQDR